MATSSDGKRTLHAVTLSLASDPEAFVYLSTSLGDATELADALRKRLPPVLADVIARVRREALESPPAPATVEMDRVSLAAYELVALRVQLTQALKERDFYRKHLGQMREFIDHLLTVEL